jgi:hypothetical protein
MGSDDWSRILDSFLTVETGGEAEEGRLWPIPALGNELENQSSSLNQQAIKS